MGFLFNIFTLYNKMMENRKHSWFNYKRLQISIQLQWTWIEPKKAMKRSESNRNINHWKEDLKLVGNLYEIQWASYQVINNILTHQYACLLVDSKTKNIFLCQNDKKKIIREFVNLCTYLLLPVSVFLV